MALTKEESKTYSVEQVLALEEDASLVKQLLEFVKSDVVPAAVRLAMNPEEASAQGPPAEEPE